MQYRACFDAIEPMIAVAKKNSYTITPSLAEDLIRALDAAGLLASDLHREALEAAEVYARKCSEPLEYYAGLDAWKVGTKSLAAKAAAKGPRWRVYYEDTAAFCGGTPADWFVQRGCEVPRAGFRTKAQAEAACAALNALPADEGQVRP